MNLYGLLRFLHVSSAILFVGGLFARQAVRSLTAGARNVETIVTITQAAGKIERLMVIPGNLLVIVFGVLLAISIRAPILGMLLGADRNWLLVSIIILVLLLPLVPLVFLPRGRLFEAALREASSKGEITQELQMQIGDPVVRLAHVAEMLGVTIVMALMIFRPF